MPRVADREVEQALRASSAVLIEGPRACGKTWTGRRHARSEVPFDSVFDHRLTAQVAPMEVLEGPVPRLLDEWQLAPDVWNAMRRACDDRRRKGQFILTGSADPPDAATRHTGTGRIVRVRMRPMSLYESGESSGRISLGELLAGGTSSAPESPGDLRDLVAVACRGGWPGLLDDSPEDAQRQLRAYLEEICRTDISRIDGVGRDPAGVRRMLASLGRNIATEATLGTLGADLAGGEGEAAIILATACRRIDWHKAARYLKRMSSKTLTRRFGWLAERAGATIPEDVRTNLQDLAKGGGKSFFGPRIPKPGAIGYQNSWQLTANVASQDLSDSASIARRRSVDRER